MSYDSAVAPFDAPSAVQRITRLRAAVALVWAAALGLAAGNADAELATGLALLVTVYPLIDVVASLAEAAHGGAGADRLRINAAVSGVAVAGLAVAAFASDVGAVLAVFGAWAVVSGLMQLGNAVQRRRAGGRELPMLISGGLSTLAGLSFVASSGSSDPSLGMLAGYAAFGAVLFLVWSRPGRTTP